MSSTRREGLLKTSPAEIPVNDHMASIDIVVMIGVAAICLPFCIERRELGRVLGVILLAFWLAYTTYLFINA